MALKYDLNDKNPFRLMQGRLGSYKRPGFQPECTSLEGVHLSAARLKTQGGYSAQARMIKGKRRSLDYAIQNSYQSAEIIKIGAANTESIEALINPHKLTQDYDTKMLSVGFEYEIQCGDIIEWVGTNTHWLVYLQELTELAYFRGTIKRCNYQINWKTESGNHSVYAALKGPDNLGLVSSVKHGIAIDTPSYSLTFLVPNNDETRKFFKRYTEFYLQDCSTCWRIEGVDALTTLGVIEVYAKEYYSNKDKDKDGIVDGLIEPIKPNTLDEEKTIRGETFIKVKQTVDYTFNGNTAGKWFVDEKYPVVLEVNSEDPRKVTLKWTGSYSGQFKLHYGDYSKTIVVESLF